MKKFCVYCHIFPNGKKYVGITCRSTKERWSHKYQSDNQPKIKRAIIKYGWKNVKHEILAEGLAEEEAKIKEKEFIKKFDSFNNGYNGTIGGDSVKTSYLNTNLLNKIRAAKKMGIFDDLPDHNIPKYIYENRKNSDIADFFNEADRAISMYYPKLENTNLIRVSMYWFEMFEYIRCDNMIEEKGSEYAKKHFKHRIQPFYRFRPGDYYYDK